MHALSVVAARRDFFHDVSLCHDLRAGVWTCVYSLGWPARLLSVWLTTLLIPFSYVDSYVLTYYECRCRTSIPRFKIVIRYISCPAVQRQCYHADGVHAVQTEELVSRELFRCLFSQCRCGIGVNPPDLIFLFRWESLLHALRGDLICN